MLVLFFSPISALADQPLLKGHALVEWSAKKRVYRFDQIVVIDRADRARFETLDDFGNTLFRLDFVGGDLTLVQKALSLPLSEEEFIAYLLYRLPRQVEGLDAEYDSYGRLIGVKKKSGQAGKRYKISFRDLEKKGSILYPKTIEMTFRKTNLKISWRNVEIYP